MHEARPAELAGKWYPGTREGCERFLDQVETAAASGLPELPERAWGAVVPHAGWVYSGAIAYRTLSLLRDRQPDADLVVVFGGHLGARDLPRIFLEGAWDTPFGPLPVARGLAEDVSMSMESELETPEEYYEDNAIEVLMPMVKRLWPQVSVVTVGMPPIEQAMMHGSDVVTLAGKRGFERIVVIGSTDLTHYGPNYAWRPQGTGFGALEWVKTRNDPEIIQKIAALDGGQVLWVAKRSRNACCPGAVASALAGARKLGARRGATVAYATSFEVRAGRPEAKDEPPTSFVGYVGVLLGA